MHRFLPMFFVLMMIFTAAVRVVASPWPDNAAASSALRLESELPIEPDLPFTARFTTKNGTLTFLLRPHSNRATDFQVKLQGAGGGFVSHTPDPPRTVRGVVVELPGAIVGGSLFDDGLHALVIDPSGNDFFVTPQTAAASDGYALIPRTTRRDDLVCAAGGAKLDAAKGIEDETSGQCATDGLCVAELALDVDSPVYAHQGMDADAVVDFAEGMANVANLRFEDRFRIRHLLTAIVVRGSAADDPYEGAGEFLLGRVGAEWCPACFPDVERDAVHLLTGRFPGAGGQAVIGGMCSATQGHALTVASDLNTSRAGTFIHETGHQWGSNHVACGIMREGAGPSTVDFCGDSIPAIEAKRDFLEPHCLDLLVPDDLILADDFETADLGTWSSIEDAGGQISASDRGAIFGKYSLRLELTSAAGLWVRDDWPTEESRYRARFYVDLRGGSMSGAFKSSPLRQEARATVFAGSASSGGDLFRVELRHTQSLVPYSIRAVVLDDSGTEVATPWTGIVDAGSGPFAIEIDWRAATAAGAADGELGLWLDDLLLDTLTGLDNDLRRVDRVRLGVMGPFNHPVDQGTIIFDNFESRREQPIGKLQ